MPKTPVADRNPSFEAGGVIKVSGNFLLDHEEDILGLVRHQGKLVAEKNPQAKITNIKKANGGLVITISDHNLAMKIGKALTSAYKGDHNYKFSHGDQFVEVEWKRD